MLPLSLPPNSLEAFQLSQSIQPAKMFYFPVCHSLRNRPQANSLIQIRLSRRPSTGRHPSPPIGILLSFGRVGSRRAFLKTFSMIGQFFPDRLFAFFLLCSKDVRPVNLFASHGLKEPIPLVFVREVEAAGSSAELLVVPAAEPFSRRVHFVVFVALDSVFRRCRENVLAALRVEILGEFEPAMIARDINLNRRWFLHFLPSGTGFL